MSPQFFMENSNNKKFSNLYDWLSSIVSAILVVIICFTFIFRTSVVSGSSMVDTLHNGEMLIISRFMYKPQYGDIVVATKPYQFDNNGNPISEPIIKRIIALPGQSVDIDFYNGIVYVDGKELDEPYTNTYTNLYEGVDFPVIVPEGCVFCMGDNRNNSLDSRSTEIGMIDERYILGRAICRLKPFTRLNEYRK